MFKTNTPCAQFDTTTGAYTQNSMAMAFNVFLNRTHIFLHYYYCFCCCFRFEKCNGTRVEAKSSSCIAKSNEPAWQIVHSKWLLKCVNLCVEIHSNCTPHKLWMQKKKHTKNILLQQLGVSCDSVVFMFILVDGKYAVAACTDSTFFHIKYAYFCCCWRTEFSVRSLFERDVWIKRVN